jgi:hypothetical protein
MVQRSTQTRQGFFSDLFVVSAGRRRNLYKNLLKIFIFYIVRLAKSLDMDHTMVLRCGACPDPHGDFDLAAVLAT